MALSTRQVGSATASGIAAATARVGNGGRNVASTTRGDVEKMDFSPHLGVNEESVLRFQQEGQLNPDGRRQQQRDQRDGFTPLLARNAYSTNMDSTDETNADGSPNHFLNDVMRRIGTYEENIRLTSPAAVKPGSVMN